MILSPQEERSLQYDLLIIGGGVNGCSIARDAAGRGLSVRLVEQNDLASGASSMSTKLIHGGLRYLELYEFKLVRQSLIERERLLANAPHIIWPLKFVLPYQKGLRPFFLLRLGLFLYDHLAPRRQLEASRAISFHESDLGSPLQAVFKKGFTYADCWVDDARLVVLNALEARERGAEISPGCALVEAQRMPAGWRAKIDNGEEIFARVLINAAGPWVLEVIEGALAIKSKKHMRLVKGSHIVTTKLYEGAQAYILQNSDGRIVFVIPYEQDFTLIGTTERGHDGKACAVEICDQEIDYLLSCVNAFFRKPVRRADIIWRYAGLRPLYDDGALEASVVTRDYAFDLDAPADSCAVLSIFGGKLTTSRRLAEHALDTLAPFFPHAGPAWTQDAALIGGDIDFEAYVAQLQQRYPFLSARTSLRLARAYGQRAEMILKDASSMSDLGQNFGQDLTQAEVSYLIQHEFARSAEDILWRRSKLGLHMTEGEKSTLRDVIGR